MNNRKGFSLMELMMVIAIISIMISVVLIYSDRTKKELEGAAREVAASIREAQNYALTGKNASASCSNEYIFTYEINSPNYSISGCIDPAISYVLKNNVEFLNEGSFSFEAPWGKVNPPSSQIIRLKKGSHCIEISVCKFGSVKESVIACPPSA